MTQSPTPASAPTFCAVYARVSTAKQAKENTSIAVQLAEAKKFADGRGWTIVGQFVDEGKSGSSDKGRPQFNAMIEEALLPSPTFTAIIVYDHSRFYRNVGQSEVTRFQLGLNGVQVHSITQPIEDDGLTGSLAITIQAAFDEHHNRITAVKVRSGMAASAREGFFVGGTIPYGYRLEPVERRGTKIKKRLAIEPVEAGVIKTIFDLYLQGAGIKTITTRLNADGIRNRKGHKWYASTVGKILTLATYAGTHQFKPTNWRTKKRVHRSEWIDIPCPAIIDECAFQNVQRLLRERDPRMTPPRTTTSDVLLAKVAKCGSCGGNLQKQTGTSRNKAVHHYYKCSAKVNTGICPGGAPVSIPRDYLDDLVIKKLADELLTPARVREIVSRAHDLQAEARGNASARVEQLKQQLAMAKRKEGKLWELAADLGVRARQGFLSKLDALEEETASLQRQILINEDLLAKSIRPLSDFEATQKATKMRQLLFGSDPKQKRRFVQAVVETVVVREDVIEITGAQSTVAETATGVDIRSRPPVRGSEREWCRLQDSNL